MIVTFMDFRRRSIWLWPMLLLWMAGFGFRHQDGALSLLQDFAWNFLFVIAILLGVLIVYRLFGVKKVMDRKLGWGDIIFLTAIASWFDPAGFLLFYEASLVITLFIFLFLKIIRRNPGNYPIPLAGTLAALLIPFVPLYKVWGYQFLLQILP